MNTSVEPPGWHGLIVWYFFLGGIASGAYVTAALVDVVGRDEDRRAVRGAYYLAFPLVVLCGILLVVDLGRPERFWHMLVQSNTGRPMLKWWSPMSAGSWGLSLFGAFSAAAFIGVLAQDGWLPSARLGHLAGRLRTNWVGRLFALGGAASAFFVGGYTGVLLNATNQPIWADSTWIGALFLASAASTGAAAMTLVAPQFEPNLSVEARKRIEWVDSWATVLELALLGVFAVSLDALAVPAFTRWPGVVVPALVAPVGLALPLTLRMRFGQRAAIPAAVLTLASGFLLRWALVGMPESLIEGGV